MSHIQPLTLGNKRSSRSFADLINTIAQAKRERYAEVKIEVRQDRWNNIDRSALPRLEVATGVTTFGRECLLDARHMAKQSSC